MDEDTLKKVLEVATRLTSIRGTLDIQMRMLAIETGGKVEDMQVAIVHKNPDGSGKVGSAWSFKEFMADLTKLDGLLNAPKTLTPWADLVPMKTSDALDVMFEEINDSLMAGSIQLVDDYINTVDLSVNVPSLWVGLLSITLSCKEALPSRPAFFDKVHAEYTAIGKDAEQVLKGLR